MRRTQPLGPAEHAILGLLYQSPSHGYELAEWFGPEGEFGDVCRVHPSLLYSHLKRLESLGYVVASVERQVGRPPRHIYNLTDVGRAEFWRWLEQPARRNREIRLEFLLRLYLSQRMAGHGYAPFDRRSACRQSRAAGRPEIGVGAILERELRPVGETAAADYHRGHYRLVAAVPGATGRPASRSGRVLSAAAARLFLAAVCLVGLTIVSTGCQQSNPAGRDELVVAAASSLRFAFQHIAASFERQAGAKVTVIFGSSGSLTTQIEQGAPIDILFAANEGFIQRLRDHGKIVPSTQQVYALGRIALAVNHRSGIKSPELPDLLDPSVRRIAVANPAHAPYGQAAKQVLEQAGLWDQLQPKLVLAESVEQTAQFLRTGNAEAAIIAWSVAESPEIEYQLIETSLHLPLRHAAAVVAESPRQDFGRAGFSSSS